MLVGGSVALVEGYWSPRILVALAGAIAVQVGTNLTNVSFNWKAVGSGENEPIDPRGSSAPVQRGLLTPSAVRRVAWVAFGFAAAIGAGLVWSVGWPLLLFGIAGLAIAYFYSAPPVRLGYRGLGVVAVFVAIGPLMVVGSYFTVTRTVSPAAMLASLPVGLLAAGIMHTNDLRDHDGDLRHGKRTLSTMLGREGSARLLLALVAGAYVTVAGGVLFSLLPAPTLIVVVTLPLALRQIRLVFRERSPERLNDAWTLGVQLLGAFGGVFIAGLLVGAWLR